MTIQVLKADLYLHPMRTRMPFRYGIAEMTAIPHLFLRLTCEVDGERAEGLAADGLAPKWFTKNPKTTYEEELDDMLEVIRHAAAAAVGSGRQGSVFGLWQQVYAEQGRWAEAAGHPPLLWGFGVSLMERAAIEAWCRAKGTAFPKALHANAFGIRLGDIHSQLRDVAPSEFLPSAPPTTIGVRHTVGLSDPLVEAEIPPDERLDDGLPQSLEASIHAYGLRFFKIKLSGDPEQDLDRLGRIRDLFGALELEPAGITLDGNEQFADIGRFRAFWGALAADPELDGLLQRLAFVEQPVVRVNALSDEAAAQLQAWPDRPPIIIDESDGELGSLPRALACGYAGTSHKNCKGIFKSIANAALLVRRKKAEPVRTYILSGEDLANVGPVALLQDLTVAACLGIPHVERNGHHYFRGLSGFPPAVQESVLTRHLDLYRREGNFATLRIREGRVSIETLLDAPFGYAARVDLGTFEPVEAGEASPLVS